MKQCPNCGAQINDDSHFCTECGKPIPQGSVCPHCGASVNDGDSFCQSCGKSVKDSQSNEPLVYEEEKEKGGFKKYLPYIIGAFVLLMIIGYCSSNESTLNNEETKDAVVTDSIEEGTEEEVVTDSVVSDDSFNNQLNETYMNLISERGASQYYLSDISGDGFPELFLKKYFDVTYSIDVYTIYNDSTILLLAIGGSGNDKEYIGKNYLLSLSSGKDYCVWSKYEFKKYDSYSIHEDIVYKGYLEDNENFYKEPTDPLIAWNNVSNEQSEESTNLDWLQGHWVYEQGNYKGHFIIQGNTITQYSSMNPEPDETTFRIEDGVIRARLIDGMDLVVPIDFDNHRIDYGDGNWMHKVDN